MAAKKKTCETCGRNLNENRFYTYKDGSKTQQCKDCMTMHIDNFDPQTYVWLLQKMDVPYIKEEWDILLLKAYERAGNDPSKLTGMSVFGKYLSKMKLLQWKDYSWKDTQRLQAQKQAQKQAKRAAQQQQLKLIQEQFEQGLISQAQYRTRVDLQNQKDRDIAQRVQDIANGNDGYVSGADGSVAHSPLYNSNEFVSVQSLNLPDPTEGLTEEDKVYLVMKWGAQYSLYELLSLEKNYVSMERAFSVDDPDSATTLRFICKTSLKMNQALDNGLIDQFQKLSRTYDQLRKSSNFSAAALKGKQNQDQINSAGELIQLCQKYGGAIPRYDISTPRDIVDQVIQDLKDYTSSLIKEDPALAREIESYLQKRNSLLDRDIELQAARKQGSVFLEVSQEDLIDFHDQEQAQRQQDRQTLQQEEGTGGEENGTS